LLDLRLPLVILILLGVLADALATRMGLDMRLAPVLAWARTLRHGESGKRKRRMPRWPWIFRREPRPLTTTATEAGQTSDVTEAPLPAADETRRRNRYARAKRGQ
jgi:hypothetical protein